MAADMQDPPSLLPEMMRILENGEYDSVDESNFLFIGKIENAE